MTEELPSTELYEPKKTLAKGDSDLYILSDELARDAHSYLDSVIEHNLIPNPTRRMIKFQDRNKITNSDESQMRNPNLERAYVFSSNDTILHGSSIFGQAAISPFLRKKGYRVADLSELTRSLVPNDFCSYSLDLKRTSGEIPSYSERFGPAIVDFGVVISEKESGAEMDSLLTGNDFIRSELLGLVREHGEYKLPLLIPSGSLEVVYGLFRDTGYGFLYLKLADNPKIISSQILNKSGFFSLKDIDPISGLPGELRPNRRPEDEFDFEKKQSRRKSDDCTPLEFEFVPPKSGISRAYIYTTYPSFNLDYTHFSNSNWHGKTVLVKE